MRSQTPGRLTRGNLAQLQTLLQPGSNQIPVQQLRQGIQDLVDRNRLPDGWQNMPLQEVVQAMGSAMGDPGKYTLVNRPTNRRGRPRRTFSPPGAGGGIRGRGGGGGGGGDDASQGDEIGGGRGGGGGPSLRSTLGIGGRAPGDRVRFLQDLGVAFTNNLNSGRAGIQPAYQTNYRSNKQIGGIPDYAQGLTVMSSYLRQMPKTIGLSTLAANQQTDQASQLWNAVPGATFNTITNRWQGPIGAPRRPNPALQARNQLLAATNIKVQQALQSVSPLLYFVNARLKDLGFSGVGQISKNSIPLYIGRWYDKNTKRIKAFMKPKYVIDPTDWQQNVAKSIFNAVNKWNAFARAQQKVYNVLRNRDKFPKKRQIAFKKSAPGAVHKNIMKNALKNIVQGTHKFWGNLPPARKDKILDAIKRWTWEDFSRQVQEAAQLLYANAIGPQQQLMFTFYTNFNSNVSKRISAQQIKLGLGKAITPNEFNFKLYKDRNKFVNNNDLNPFSQRRIGIPMLTSKQMGQIYQDTYEETM